MQTFNTSDYAVPCLDNVDDADDRYNIKAITSRATRRALAYRAAQRLAEITRTYNARQAFLAANPEVSE